MYVFRLCKPAFSELDGEGSRIYGGRWNFIGNPMVYASCQLSLALLELLVHTDIDLIPEDLVSLKIDIPEHVSQETMMLPKNWHKHRDDNLLKHMGTQWLTQKRSAVLLVPSIIVPNEKNVLINPLHADIKHIHTIEKNKFQLDERLFN